MLNCRAKWAQWKKLSDVEAKKMEMESAKDNDKK